MQHLHLVGFTAELDGLIFSAKRGSRSGGYVIALDDRLLDAIREAVRLQTGTDVDLEGDEDDDDDFGPTEMVPELRRLGRVHSALSPKEIQARLRAGRTTAEVADEAEVDESWILRFASPVLAEQSRVVERALAVPCRANRKGESAEPLSESVAENLIERGMLLTEDELSSGWSAYHVRDSSWVVRFRYVSRRRQQVAQWAFDLVESTLVPLNRLATDLGYLDSARRKRRPGLADVTDDRRASDGDDPMARPAAATRAPKRATTAKRTRKTSGRTRSAAATNGATRPAKKAGAANRRAAAKKAPARKTAARPAASKSPARKSAAGKALASKAAPRKAAASKAAASKAAASKAAARKAAPRKAAAAKTAAGKAAARKAAARKTAPRKTAAAKTAAGKAAPRTAAARKTAATKSAASKSMARKTAARKTVARKTVARKAVARKAVARKVTGATRKVTAATRNATAAKAAAANFAARSAAAPPVAAREAATPRILEPVTDVVVAAANVNGAASAPGTPAVRTRRPAVAVIRREPPAVVGRRTRPLVAVRAVPKSPPPEAGGERAPGAGGDPDPG